MTERTIFDYLANIDKHNVGFFDMHSEEEQKKFSAFMCMMWLSFSKSNEQVVLINDVVNRYIFSLYKHPKLIWMLLCLCGKGSSQKYQYVKRIEKEQSKKQTLEIIQQYYSCSLREAISYLSLFKEVEQVVDLANALGYEKTQITELKKEWK